jgi:hypothetical protein
MPPLFFYAPGYAIFLDGRSKTGYHRKETAEKTAIILALVQKSFFRHTYFLHIPGL